VSGAAPLKLARRNAAIYVRALAAAPRLYREALRAGARLRREAPAGGIDDAVSFCRSFSWNGGELMPLQNELELRALLALLERERPKTVVEIGSYSGGSLFLWSRVAASDATLVAVDVTDRILRGRSPRAYFCRAFQQPSQKLTTLFGRDSHDPVTRREVERALRGKKIDFLFIDGDHTYEGVAADFELYVDLVREGGLIAFHDIVHEMTPGFIEVARFWRDFAGRHATEELIGEGLPRCGIGLFRVGVRPVGG
jgi:predicted O-methyltransferase YrrM